MTKVLAAVSVAAMTAAFSLLGQPLAAGRSRHVSTQLRSHTRPVPGSTRPRSRSMRSYAWPNLAGVAVFLQRPRFRFEEMCASPPTANDPRDFAVAAKANLANPPGQWQLQVQVLHWRGESAYGGQLADQVVRSAATALRACQVSAPSDVAVDNHRRTRQAVIGSQRRRTRRRRFFTSTLSRTRRAARSPSWPCGRRHRRRRTGR